MLTLWWSVGAFGLAVLLCAVLIWRDLRRPKYLITIQKQTNTTRQPETLTIQANLRGSVSPSDVWMEAELMALAATSRMESINQDILEETKAEADLIAERRAELAEERARHQFERTRRKLSRRLGKKLSDVTDEDVRAAQGRATLQVPPP